MWQVIEIKTNFQTASAVVRHYKSSLLSTFQTKYTFQPLIACVNHFFSFRKENVSAANLPFYLVVFTSIIILQRALFDI
jgi:hypothetical protein